jgi:hypothetical protein
MEGLLGDSPKSPLIIEGVVDMLLDGKQHCCVVPVVVVDAKVHILGMASQARHPQWTVLTVGMALHVNLHSVPLLAMVLSFWNFQLMLQLYLSSSAALL